MSKLMPRRKMTLPSWNVLRKMARKGTSVMNQGLTVVDADGDDVDDGGLELRHGDEEELPELAGAVEGGGLVVVGRDRLHAGQEVHHVDAGPAPEGDHEEGDEAGQVTLQPLDRAIAEELDDLVDHGRVGLGEHQPEDDARDHHGRQRRDEHGGLEEALDLVAADLGVDQGGQDHGDRDEQDEGADHVAHGVAQRLPEDPVAEQLLVVLGADELGLAVEDLLGAHDDGPDERRQPEQDQGQDERQDEQVGRQLLRVQQPPHQSSSLTR
jgi:hypothetical protein